MTVSTGKYYTQMNASSFGTFPNDRLMLGDHLTEVTVDSGSILSKSDIAYIVTWVAQNFGITKMLML